MKARRSVSLSVLWTAWPLLESSYHTIGMPNSKALIITFVGDRETLNIGTIEGGQACSHAFVGNISSLNVVHNNTSSFFSAALHLLA